MILRAKHLILIASDSESRVGTVESDAMQFLSNRTDPEAVLHLDLVCRPDQRHPACEQVQKHGQCRAHSAPGDTGTDSTVNTWTMVWLSQTCVCASVCVCVCDTESVCVCVCGTALSDCVCALTVCPCLRLCLTRLSLRLGLWARVTQ